MLRPLARTLLLVLFLAINLTFVVSTASAQNNPQSDDEVIDMSFVFVGNRVFSREQLMSAMHIDEAPLHPGKLDENLQRLRLFMGSYGYIRATVDEPEISKIAPGGTIKITIDEGKRYRFGELKVAGATLFTPAELLELSGMKTGEIASSTVIREGVFENIRLAYGERGYVQAVTDLLQEFHDSPDSDEGTVDFTIRVEEGRQFKVRSIRFQDCPKQIESTLTRELLLKKGDVYNQRLMDLSMKKIVETGLVELTDDLYQLLCSDKIKSKNLDIVIYLKTKK